MKCDTPSDLRFYHFNLTSMIRSSASKGAFKRQREPRRGLLASFAIALGAALCSPSFANAPMQKIVKITDKQQAINYAKAVLNKTQYKCLLHLYAKESAWDRTAYNKQGDAYGIPQLQNSIIKNMTSIMQVSYGLKYINHRYHGDTCIAYKHWLQHGWH